MHLKHFYMDAELLPRPAKAHASPCVLYFANNLQKQSLPAYYFFHLHTPNVRRFHENRSPPVPGENDFFHIMPFHILLFLKYPEDLLIGIRRIVICSYLMALRITPGKHAYSGRHTSWIRRIASCKITSAFCPGIQKRHGIQTVSTTFSQICTLLI